MITTWRDHPYCPHSYDERAAWNAGHRCADCADFVPCPCGCGWGWCDLDGYHLKAKSRCCGEGIARGGQS